MATTSFKELLQNNGAITATTFYRKQLSGSPSRIYDVNNTGDQSLKGNMQTASSFYKNTTRPIFSQEGRNHDGKNFGFKSSTHGTDNGPLNVNIFSESIVEQAQMKKPPFNIGTFRPPTEASKHGFVSFNPGPGSYSTRINALGSQFIDVKDADKIFKGLVSQQGLRDKNAFYYTRENGGLKQHNQPLSLGQTNREGVVINPQHLLNKGPGHYNPKLP